MIDADRCETWSSVDRSAGSGATIVGESTVPKKTTGIIAVQAGSSKIMHPEEDLSLEELRARHPRYQRSQTTNNSQQTPTSTATAITSSPSTLQPSTASTNVHAGLGIPMVAQQHPQQQHHHHPHHHHIPAGMMIPMAMPHMAFPPHMQMAPGMGMGLIRAPHMPGTLHYHSYTSFKFYFHFCSITYVVLLLLLKLLQGCPADLQPTVPHLAFLWCLRASGRILDQNKPFTRTIYCHIHKRYIYKNRNSSFRFHFFFVGWLVGFIFFLRLFIGFV